VEIIELLIAKSNNVDLQSKEQKTALLYAIDYNKQIVDGQNNDSIKQTRKISKIEHENILKLIVEKSNNLDVQNGDGYTPLMLMLQMKCSNKLIKLIIEKSEILVLQNCFGDTVLMFEVKDMHISDTILDLLVD